MKESHLNVDDFELQCVSALTSGTNAVSPQLVLEEVVKRILAEIRSCGCSVPSDLRSHLSAWWRVLGTCIDASLSVSQLTDSLVLFESIVGAFDRIKAALDAAASQSGLDPLAKDTVMIYSGFNLAYTSAVRSALESLHALADPLLGCEILLGLERCIPMDSKGNANVYKRVRQVEDDSVRETLSAISPEAANGSFEEGNVVLGDASKAFERFWTMMDVSRRNDPELLTETKSWGKFSQSATASLNLLLDQPDALDASSWVAREPVEYACRLSAFPIQMSSASFRRRAVFNMLFVCSYVAQSSSNALITAAAKAMHSNILNSLPKELQQALATVTRFDNHWVAWKSSAHSKEVCGPFERRSRIERNMQPFGEPLVDLTAVNTDQPPASPPHLTENKAIQVMECQSSDGHIFEANQSELFAETLKRKISEYRQYVSDAILCDISDDAEREGLRATDEGMEEAMRNNNDRVLLWQFRRMRFSTDLKSFSRQKSVASTAASGETTPVAPSPADPAQQDA